MSNYFAILNTDSNDSEEQDYIVDNGKLSPDVQDDEKSDKYLSVSARNLALNSVFIARKTDHAIIVKAKEYLWKLMNKYIEKMNAEKFIPSRACHFTDYIYNSDRFFERILIHYEGMYSGEIISLYSWYMGRSETGKPIYIYIGTHENYGSCSVCDGILGLEDKIRKERKELSKMRDNLKNSTDENEKDKLRLAISDLLSAKRKFMINYISFTFNGLKFFISFKEAKKWVYNIADDPKSIVFKEFKVKPKYLNLSKLVNDELSTNKK